MMKNALVVIITCLCVLLSVAYFTLLERKVLGILQIRKGPNKVGFWGLFQPLSDALKLFVKENLMLINTNKLAFYFIPAFGLFLGLYIWVLLPSEYSLKFMTYGLLLFLCISSLNVYITLFAGWSSNSVYAFLGGIRAGAQAISYEVSMILILMFPVVVLNTLCWNQALTSFTTAFLMLPLLIVWFSSILAETNRAPFDFAEGESELVSGFNIEYQSGSFALLFLAEYAIILFMSITTVVWFSFNYNSIMMMFMSFFIMLSFLFARGVFPRFRYDLLMMLCWKIFLPFSLMLLIYSVIFLQI